MSKTKYRIGQLYSNNALRIENALIVNLVVCDLYYNMTILNCGHIENVQLRRDQKFGTMYDQARTGLNISFAS